METTQIRRGFARYGERLGYAAAFLLPLRLNLSYIALIPLILLWLVQERDQRGRPHSDHPGIRILWFYLIAALGCLVAADPLESVSKLGSAIIFVSIIFIFCDLGRVHGVRNFLLAAILGQSVAALHTFLEATLPDIVPRMFIGAMSESGQLTLSIPAVVGMLIALRSRVTHSSPKDVVPYALGAVFLFLLVTLGFFSQSIRTPLVYASLFAGVLTILTYNAVALYRGLKHSRDEVIRFFFASTALPLLISALLLNLKRGPWVGVILGLLILFLCTRTRVAVPTLILTLLVAASITPIRDRILAAHDHFFIAGGRGEMWEIGSELATRYPLGIGFKNSHLLREYSADIPPQHEHFHNTPLNILVETGWLGLGVYLWWVCHTIMLGLGRASNRSTSILAIALASGFVALQIAGFVEYNFGDSEVRNLSFLYLGLLAALTVSASSES